MKKFFSLFYAILIAGTLMADVFNLEKVTKVEDGKSYVFVRNDHALKAEVANDKLQTEEEFLTEELDGSEAYVWKLEKADGGFYLKSGDNYLNNTNKKTNMYLGKSSSVWKITFSNGAATFTNKSNSDRYLGETSKGSNEYKAYSEDGHGDDFTAYVLVEAAPSDKPAITAKKIDFGTVTISADKTSFELDTTLDVTGKNLTEAIAVSAEKLTVTETSLPAEGGKLHLHISAAVGSFEGKVKLASGETKLEVSVIGNVKQQGAVQPGGDAKIIAGTNATEAKVNGKNAFKVGSGSSNGEVTIVVPTGATILKFYAAAWNKGAGTILVSASKDVDVAPTSVNLEEDTGISGTSTSFTLESLEESDCLYEFQLKGVDAEKQITVKSGTARRFVIWGASYETTPTAIDNTALETKAVKVYRNGQILIIKNGVTYDILGNIIK